MPHDEKRVAEMAAWLGKARADLESANVLLSSGIPSQFHQVLFHCQQAVEKSLKAFLFWNQISFRWTHDIAEIGNQCTQVDKSLETIIENAKYLSDYAWTYRYPGEDPDPKKPEASAGLEAGKKVFLEILKRIPEELQSKFALTRTHPKIRSPKKRPPKSQKKK